MPSLDQGALTPQAPRMVVRCAAFIVLSAIGWGSVRAEGEGQVDLDQAVVKRLEAQNLGDLEEVAGLLKSAIAKGLDQDNETLAESMLAGVNLQRGQALFERIKQSRNFSQSVRKLRDEALRSLESAIELDPNLTEAHLLIARLNVGLPEGDKQRAVTALDKAIGLITDDGKKRSEALLLRALLRENDEERMADLDAAVAAAPDSTEAMQARALHLLQKGQFEAAIVDLRTVMQQAPENVEVAQAAVLALANLEKLDEAMELVDGAIASSPETAGLYRLRAAVLREKDELPDAVAALDKALELDADDVEARLQRAELRLQLEDAEGAKEDVDRVLTTVPGSVQGILLRSFVAVEQKRYADAISDMQLLIKSFPDNVEWSLQLASLYQLDDRPRQAIDLVTTLIKADDTNWRAFRLRADSRLSVGEHKLAIEDYEKAIAIGPPTEAAESGVLNNLAWVLATSPIDDVRNGKRALELAEKACQITEFKEAHIVSTLAAAHAELGDFPKAIEWSEKAVAIGREEDNEQLEQLEEELESYRAGKPWREEQKVEENKVPILDPEEVIDT
jgi:tetratricopeptide (TPR) repeat protein